MFNYGELWFGQLKEDGNSGGEYIKEANRVIF